MSFKARFKSAKSLISIGKEFHSFGANEEKALSPIDLKRVKGTEGQFQMSEGHVLEYKELKAQRNNEVPTHVKPCNVHSIIWFSMYVNLSIICIKVKF